VLSLDVFSNEYTFKVVSERAQTDGRTFKSNAHAGEPKGGSRVSFTPQNWAHGRSFLFPCLGLAFERIADIDDVDREFIEDLAETELAQKPPRE
jgi:hypothetical protein